MKYFLLLFLMGLVLISCDDEEKVTQRFSYPEWQKDKFLKEDSNKSLFLFTYGNITENLLPKRELKSAHLPKSMPHSLDVGGVAVLTSYLKIIKQRFGEHAVFLGDGGLNYFGSDKIKKKLIATTMKELPLDGLLLSKDDILKTSRDKVDFLVELPWFNSNILAIKTGEPTELYSSKPYALIQGKELRLGIIGNTSYKLLSAQERNEISGFYFQDPVTTVLRTKNQLSQAGVDLVALYYEGPLSCQHPIGPRHIPFSELPKLNEICQKDSELVETLKRLPPNSIDLVITNTPGFAGALFEKIPVLSQFSPQDFIQGIKLIVKDSKVDLKNSWLLEPVKLCHQFFAGTQDCLFDLNNEDLNEERFEFMENTSFGIIKARFLGHEINEDPTIMKVFNDR